MEISHWVSDEASGLAGASPSSPSTHPVSPRAAIALNSKAFDEGKQIKFVKTHIASILHMLAADDRPSATVLPPVFDRLKVILNGGPNQHNQVRIRYTLSLSLSRVYILSFSLFPLFSAQAVYHLLSKKEPQRDVVSFSPTPSNRFLASAVCFPRGKEGRIQRVLSPKLRSGSLQISFATTLSTPQLSLLRCERLQCILRIPRWPLLEAQMQHQGGKI